MTSPEIMKVELISEIMELNRIGYKQGVFCNLASRKTLNNLDVRDLKQLLFVTRRLLGM